MSVPTDELIRQLEERERNRTSDLIALAEKQRAPNAEGLPEPPATNLNFLRVALARGNPIEQAQIFKENNPEATIDFDAKGYPIAIMPDGTHYAINRPGFSEQDVADVGIDLVSVGGGAGLAAKAGAKALGPIGRVLGGALGAGAGSLAIEAAGQAAGGEAPNQRRVAVDAIFGAGGEIAAPYIERFLARVFTNQSLVKNGVLTDEGKKIIESAGGDPSKVSSDVLNLFAQRAADPTMDAAEIFRRSRAESLPTPINLTTGQATRNAEIQTREQMARMGAFSNETTRQATDVFSTQEQAFAENLTKMLGGRVPLKGEGAGRVGDAIKAQASTDKDVIREAYKSAREKGALVAADQIRGFRATSQKLLMDRGFDLARMPETKAILDTVSAMDKAGSTKLIKLEAIKNLRERITLAQRSTKDGREQLGLSLLKKELDTALDDAVDRGLISGSDDAVQAYKNARDLFKDYAARFKSDKVVERIVKENLTPEETANLIFGASRIGARQGATRTLATLKKSLGGVEIRALQEEGLIRLFVKNGEIVSPQVASTNIKRALTEDWTLMAQLYKPEEIRLLKQLAEVATDITPIAGTVNRSGSGNWIIQARKLGGGGLGVVSELLDRLGRKGYNALEASRVREALVGEVTRRRLIPAGVGAGVSPVGGMAAASESPEPRP